jgi:2,4-diketo-3-deoxy-L-fuconate hydrolase
MKWNYLALMCTLIINFQLSAFTSDAEAIAIAPPDLAITIARTGQTILLVTGADQSGITGIDAGEYIQDESWDTIDFFKYYGYEQIVSMIDENRSVRVSYESLLIPFETVTGNIGAGLNYSDHTEELKMKRPPFFFPKIVEPTSFNAPLDLETTRSLDYEAEIGIVLLEDYTGDSMPTHLGFILCNDFSDRRSLMKNMVITRPFGTTGFADGKSKPGYLPVGPWLVIPRSYVSFHELIDIRLTVNDQARQNDNGSSMVWGPMELLEQVPGYADLNYYYQGKRVDLLAGNKSIMKGTVIMTGTPAGVMFRVGNTFNSRLYLQSGDIVITSATYLGSLSTRIVSGKQAE